MKEIGEINVPNFKSDAAQDIEQLQVNKVVLLEKHKM